MERIALYSRVSTDEQNPVAQRDALRDYAARRGAGAVEFEDRASGSNRHRPALDALMEAVHRREVGAVAVTKLDRLARSVRHLCDLAADLEARGVALIVLDQAIDTSTSAGRFMFHTLAAVAELERDLIRERTRAGVAAARRRGRCPGRPRALAPEQVARARRMRTAGRSYRHVAQVLGVGVATIDRALRKG